MSLPPKKRFRGPGVHLVARRGFSATETFDELSDFLKAIKKNARGNLRDVLYNHLGPYTKSVVVERFERGGPAADGPSTKWVPLKDVTKAAREENKTWPGFGGSQPILRATGRMQKSIKIFKSSNENTTIVRVGSGVKYSWIHQVGGIVDDTIDPNKVEYTKSQKSVYVNAFVTLKSGETVSKKVAISLQAKIPPRPAFFFTEQMADKCVNIVANYVVSQMSDKPEAVNKILARMNERTRTEVPF